MKNLFGESVGQIISASRRTDIPAFYSDWFAERLAEGFALVRNPFNPRQVRRVSLRSDDVAAIVFWTRDFSPMLRHADFLDGAGYRYVVLWTITGYPRRLEPHAAPLEGYIASFIKTAERIGPKRMALRYDPIIICGELGPGWHVANFSRIVRRLEGYTHRVIISFITHYRSVLRRLEAAGVFPDRSPLSRSDVKDMLAEIVDIAQNAGMSVQACCQGGALEPFGIPDGACIDPAWLSSALGVAVPAAKDKGQRPKCMCAKSVDVGVYNSCPRACLYCYAVKSPEAAESFFLNHDPRAPSLDGKTVLTQP